MMPAQCSPPCTSRNMSMRQGFMYWNRAHHGWVYPASYGAVRHNKVEAKPPFVWTHCPFCGGQLPDESDKPDNVAARDQPPLPPELRSDDAE